MKTKCVIGIVSYFPDEQNVRNSRKTKLINLINKCNELFKLPIMLIAQNYTNEDFNVFQNCIMYAYEDKLGITGARKELRKKFLESNYDYIIMLDDDCELHGSSAQKYLKQIDENPDCFIEFNKTLLKLFAISKTLFEKVDYEDVNPENGEGFEDRVFVNKLRIKYPEKQRFFVNTGLFQYSKSTADELSTWYKNQDLKSMLEKTEKSIKEIH